MELHHSLRSLEAVGRPSGTGRPSLPDSDANGSPRTDRDGPIREGPHAERSEHGKRETERSDDHTRRAAGRSRRAPVHPEQEQPALESGGRVGTRPAFEIELRARTLEQIPARSTSAPKATVSAVGAPVETTTDGVEPQAPSVVDVEAPTFTTTSDLGVEASADPIESLLFFQQAAVEELVDSQEFVEDGVTLDFDAPVVEEGGVENVSIRLEPASTMITQSAPTARPAPSEVAVQGVTRGLELNDPSSAPPDVAPEPPATPRADEARASEILRQVKIAISPRFEQAVIQLHPAELGRISIQLRVEKDGLVAQVRAEKREALEALEKHIPELRAALSRQGIQAGEFDLALGFHDERKSGDTRGGRSNRTRESDTNAGVDDALANTHALRRILTEGAIDTYA